MLPIDGLAHVGGALFDRIKKPIRPTELGKVALDHARHILQLSDDLRALVGCYAGTPQGELRLGVVHSLARQVIPPIVYELRLTSGRSTMWNLVGAAPILTIIRSGLHP
jgi:DNA-binding transcriptional LysR family regulator